VQQLAVYVVVQYNRPCMLVGGGTDPEVDTKRHVADTRHTDPSSQHVDVLVIAVCWPTVEQLVEV